jgi:flagellar motility protein MotE (MotC chaperone)
VRALGLLLLLCWQANAATSDPFLVSSKVQSDLDAAISRLIPTEQFLVQVNADVATRLEKRLIEGETIIAAPPEPQPAPMAPMPGFVPETEEKIARYEPPVKQAYRMVEIAELKAVRVAITFDDALGELTTTRAKNWMRNYLQVNYAGMGMLSFSTMPMLKPVKEPAREVAAVPEKKETPPVKPPLEEVEVLWNYARWASVALLVVIAVLLLTSRGKQQAPQMMPLFAGMPGGTDNRPRQRPDVREVFGEGLEQGWQDDNARKKTSNANAKVTVSAAEMAERRKKVLDRFLARSQAFRQYFSTLSLEAAAELYACLKGQAFDKLLEGLHIAQPRSDKKIPTNVDDILAQHDKDFDEFVHAKDWEDRQFFGFLHSLTDEQLATLVAGQSNEIACVVLRMMQPKQSAAVLGMMSPQKRSQILADVKNLQNVSFADLVSIERDLRTTAQRVPDRFFGSEKEDVTFWGTVVSESTNQDVLVEELVRSRPEIAGQLKKFRFRLEEAASLPDALLQRVLSAVDNEELCLALATCSKDVREVIVDVLPDLRRQVIVEMFPSFKNAHKDRTAMARQRLTRRIREAMG